MKKSMWLLVMFLSVGLAGCLVTPPRAPGEPAPGFNKKGEVIDSSRVEDGDGTKVVGLDNTKGEVFGVPSPGFARVKIGMDFANAGIAAGMPSSQRPCRAILYKCTEWIYAGEGRLVFATETSGYSSLTRLIKIVHNRTEPANP